jgi:hypothetical protein
MFKLKAHVILTLLMPKKKSKDETNKYINFNTGIKL